MKFDCDKRRDRLRAKCDARREWHQWFAWHRVRVGRNDCRWLEVVERRASHYFYIDGWQYRAIDKETV